MNGEEMESSEARAKRIVAQVARHWEDTPDAFKSERDGTIYFTFVIHGLHGSTTITYNPVPGVEWLFYRYELLYKGKVAEPRNATYADMCAFQDLTYSLKMAPKFFHAVLMELPLLAMTAMEGARNKFTWLEGEQSKLIKETLEGIIESRKLLLNAPGRGQKRKFSDGHVIAAVYTLGSNASQRQTAKKLGVTEKALRDWRVEKGFEDWETALQAVKHSEYYQEFLSGRIQIQTGGE